MNLNANLGEQCKVIFALAPAVPSSSTPAYVSLKNYERATIIIPVKNATTVTGSAITLKQATAVAGTGEKALAFTTALRNLDTGAGDTMSAFTVASNTFTTDATDSKNLLYIIDVKADDLDVNNGFDCIRAGTGNATAATVSVIYVLWGSKFSTLPTALTD